MQTQDRWYPIASGQDLPFRHIFHGQLHGCELAVWRADDGYVNIWENRCPHRGVRLSIGSNNGGELKCQYHGWRYASRTAGCTYVPAQPAEPPAAGVKVRSLAAAERYGLVWSSSGSPADKPVIAGMSVDTPLVLRALPVEASAELVAEALLSYRFQPCEALFDGEDAAVSVEEAASDEGVTLKASCGVSSTRATLLVQPVDARRSIIRGVLDEPSSGGSLRIDVLRHHNERLSALRDRVERLPAGTQAS